MITYIQIPNTFVRDGSLISDSEFAVLAQLKLLLQQNVDKDSSVVQINPLALRKMLDIKLSKNLMSYLDGLSKIGVVLKKPDNLRKSIVEIEVNARALNKAPFTQLPDIVFKHIDKIGHTGLRLLFYYESYLNRAKGHDKCWPGFRVIGENLRLSHPTIKKYNDLLVESGLLAIKYSDGAPMPTDEYDRNGNVIYRKQNNTYKVLIDKF